MSYNLSKRAGLKKISNIISRIAEPIVKKKGFYHTKIITDWQEIIGEDLSKETCPIKIISNKQKNKTLFTLYIEVNNASTATQLSYLEEFLIEKISNYIGYKVINKIKLIIVNKT